MMTALKVKEPVTEEAIAAVILEDFLLVILANLLTMSRVESCFDAALVGASDFC